MPIFIGIKQKCVRMIQITLYLSRETLKKGALIIHHFLTTCCFLLILLFTSCNPKSDKSNILVSVDIEANINNLEIVNLSRFTDNIRYVPLENIENLSLGNLSLIDISDNLILVSDMNICLLYDSEGHFITKVGNRGRGPGENPYFDNLGLSSGKNQKIYFSSIFDIFEYNIDGSFINKYTKSLFISGTYLLRDWQIINDSLFFGYINNGTGKVENKALIINKYGDIVHSYKNYILFNNESGKNALRGQQQFSKFKGSVFFKEQFNDTLFSVNDKYEMIPRYNITLGNLKLPLSFRVKPPSGEIFMDYVYIVDIFQNDNYLFLICHFGNKFPAKRLTSKPPLFPGGNPVRVNTYAVLGLYNKKSGELVFCKPSDSDNPLFTSGIYNDIDCGPRFRPVKQVNDSTLLMWVSADKLKDHVASDDFKNNVPKYPEKKKELEDLANKLTEFDNPVLMFVTFNKER